jgi:hypothetical protein
MTAVFILDFAINPLYGGLMGPSVRKLVPDAAISNQELHLFARNSFG